MDIPQKYSKLIDEVIGFDDPLALFNSMIDDIKNASKSIYLQTYKYCNDSIGRKFRDILSLKAKEGVKVKILIDAWGSGVSKSFFSNLLKWGGEVEFFEKLKLRLDIFSANHLRNHRKQLIIDSKVSYLGSANITAYCVTWREFTARFIGDIALKFENIFLEDFIGSKNIYINRKKKTRILSYDSIKIIRDVPGIRYQPVRDEILKLVKQAKHEIVIETPYFLPGNLSRKALINAVERGVNVTVIVPLNSDVKLFDILRDKYFGKYFKKNIKILQFYFSNLHSKICLIDNEVFMFGSSNIDYRSFRFMYELNLMGTDNRIVEIIKKHIEGSKKYSIEFNFEVWKNRHFVQKVIEVILSPFRHLF